MTLAATNRLQVGRTTVTRHLTKLDLATGQPVDVDSMFLDPSEYLRVPIEVADDEPLIMVPLAEDEDDEPDLIDLACVEVAEQMSFCLGTAVTHIWRAGLNGDRLADLRTAAWYLQREIGRLSADTG